MTEQRAIEIQMIGAVFLDCLGLAVSDIHRHCERQVVRRDLVAMLAKALDVITNYVVAQSACAAQTGSDRDIMSCSELDRFTAPSDRYPYRRAWPLHRSRPDGHVLV